MVNKGCILKTMYFSFMSLLLVLGITLFIMTPFFYRKLAQNQLTLSNNSDSFKVWKNNTLPLYIDFYMFNWTNPAAVMAQKNVKPQLVEVGPYVFQEVHEKVILSMNDNGTITYRQRRIWYFVPERSIGNLTDQITNVNPVALTIITLCDNLKIQFVKEIINTLLKKIENNLYVTKSVRELLFQGYEDELLELMKKFEGLFKIPPVESKFGWFYPRNNSLNYDGVMSVFTGVDNINNLGLLSSWNYENSTHFFSGDCGKVQGSAGDLYPPSAAVSDTLTIYATDICSGLTLKSKYEETVEGLSGKVFVGDERVFDNGKRFPETACYCENTKCASPPGIRDMSSCKHGAPAFLSFPHFYLADPMYASAVEGLNPNRSRHEFRFAIEKNTAIPLEVHARLQINMLLRNVPGFAITENLSHTVLPVFWFHQYTTISKAIADQLRPLASLPFYSSLLSIGLCSLSLVLLMVGIYWVRNGKFRSPLLHARSVSPLLHESQTESTPNVQEQEVS